MWLFAVFAVFTDILPVSLHFHISHRIPTDDQNTEAWSPPLCWECREQLPIRKNAENAVIKAIDEWRKWRNMKLARIKGPPCSIYSACCHHRVGSTGGSWRMNITLKRCEVLIEHISHLASCLCFVPDDDEGNFPPPDLLLQVLPWSN